jgi:3-phenylpropionate/trans-cinnamate dioxygenase ferredoxin reductase subunit
VDFRLERQVGEIQGVARMEAAALSDGSVLEADLALVGIGVLPNLELARDAGLEVGDGIVVDASLRASDPNISAVGDVALHPNRFSALGPVRLESVQNAADQGRTVAAALAGAPKVYAHVPWFWSDQGDLKLQIAGLGAGHDEAVTRGDPADGAFSVFLFRQGRFLACESVNRPADHMVARRLLQADLVLTPEQAADETKPLKALLPPR